VARSVESLLGFEAQPAWASMEAARMTRMRFIDGHCDTILKICAGGDFLGGASDERQEATVDGHAAAREAHRTAGGTDLHVTLPGMLAAGVAAQVFAVFTGGGPPTTGGGASAPGSSSGRDAGPAMGQSGSAGGDGHCERATLLLEEIDALCRRHEKHLAKAGDWRAVAAALGEEDRIAVIPGIEGALPLEGDAGRLKDFYDLGVRVLTIAWGDSKFCGAVFGTGGGLTRAGSELVEFCNELGVVVDVSHVSDEAFFDVCAAANAPFIASHSNCRRLSPFRRNLTDEMIRTLAQAGGVMGINLGSSFLSQEFYAREKESMDEFFRAVNSGERTFEEAVAASHRVNDAIPRPPLTLVAAHVKHAIRVGGEDCVGLGGDLDGVESLPVGLEGVADYPKIARLLAEAGLSERQVEKVCYGNFSRVFREVLG
jgi:microsomal dipeptidase-like Zn-dependent dipeptidase